MHISWTFPQLAPLCASLLRTHSPHLRVSPSETTRNDDWPTEERNLWHMRLANRFFNDLFYFLPLDAWYFFNSWLHMCLTFGFLRVICVFRKWAGLWFAETNNDQERSRRCMIFIWVMIFVISFYVVSLLSLKSFVVRVLFRLKTTLHGLLGHGACSYSRELTLALSR